MNNQYDITKQEIKNLLLSEPIDAIDVLNQQLLSVPIWESVLERTFSNFATRKLGSANVLKCLELLTTVCAKEIEDSKIKIEIEEMEKTVVELFQQIIEELEKEKIVRKTPESIREEFKLVINNGE